MAENIAVPYEVYSRQQLAKEMEELANKPLDEVTEGGRFIGTDGKLHDSEGRPIDEKAAEGDASFDAATASRDDLAAEAERRSITIEGTGKDGYITVDDYRKALA